MSEGDHITRNEFKINNKSVDIKLSGIQADISENKEEIGKRGKLLLGNGEGGIMWKVNTLMLRNQWIDKGVNIFIGIGASLLTLWLTGVLHL